MKKFLKCLSLILVCVLSSVVFYSCSDNSKPKNLSIYNFELKYNDTDKTVEGELDLIFNNNFCSSLKNLSFHLWANGFSKEATIPTVSKTNFEKTYPNGISYGKIEILSAEINEQVVPFEIAGIDSTILILNPLKEIVAGSQSKIDISFKTTIPNASHRFGYGDNTINLTGFFPILSVFENGAWDMNPYSPNGDPFYTEVADYNVKISYPSSLQLASTGKKIESNIADNFITDNLIANSVRDFAIILGRDFKIVSQKVDGTLISLYTFKDTDPAQSLKISVQSVQTFNDLFGKYAYDTLAVVESDFVHGGMEFPNLVMISGALNAREEQNQVIVHEIAHQWWYGMVGGNAFKNGWMDEGLTEFSTALFFDKTPEYGIKKQTIIQNATQSYVTFIDVFSEVFGSVDTTMNRSLNDYKTEPEYVYMAYVKGMLLYDSLFEFIGERKFLQGCKDLQKNYKFKNIEPEDLIIVFQKASKMPLEGFFSAWIDGKVVIA